MRLSKKLGILGAVLLTNFARAESESTERIFLHPFSASQATGTNSEGLSFTLWDSFKTPSGLRQKSESLLKNLGLNSSITAHARTSAGFRLQADPGISVLDYRFMVDDIPLCQYHVKALETRIGEIAVFGKMPRFEISGSFQISEWPNLDRAQAVAADALSARNLSNQIVQLKSEACLWRASSVLRPVWVLELEAGGLNYLIVADEQQIYKFQPKHFHANGKTRIYPNNLTDGVRQEFSLREMDASGKLANRYFVTEVESGSRIFRPNFDFTFDPSADVSEFAEVSLFTNANRALEWLESKGYKNFGTTPMRIAVHADFQGDRNNALYQPGTNFDTIYVGDGDGVVLANLATDADVVSHELGHHVVYESITEIAGESLVLHEGLADYFTFARTQNACLGESICPDTAYGNRICAVPKKCLRTAENDLKLTSPDLPREPHLKSQFISGFLWDLGVKDGMVSDDVTHLALKTIDLLVADSGYQDFVVGMLMADRDIFQGANCSKILERAKNRGLGNYLTGIDCTALPTGTKVRLIDAPAQVAPASKESSSKGSSKSLCGVISGTPGSGGHMGSFLILFMLPIIIAISRLRIRQ